MAAGSGRLTSVVLYGTTVVLVAAGLGWWFGAAPEPSRDGRVRAAEETLSRLLPEQRGQVHARTHVLRPRDALTSDAPAVFPGPHRLLLACSGKGQVLVRPGPAQVPGQRVVPCADAPLVVEVAAVLDGPFFLTVFADAPTAVVFRWKLVRAAA